jgi:hypothetical protein
MLQFFVFRKSGLIKSCSSSEDLSRHTILWSFVDWCKFYIHLKSLNVCHFGMVAATSLKLWLWGQLQWHDPPTEVHKSLPIGSEVEREGHNLMWNYLYCILLLVLFLSFFVLSYTSLLPSFLRYSFLIPYICQSYSHFSSTFFCLSLPYLYLLPSNIFRSKKAKKLSWYVLR